LRNEEEEEVFSFCFLLEDEEEETRGASERLLVVVVVVVIGGARVEVEATEVELVKGVVESAEAPSSSPNEYNCCTSLVLGDTSLTGLRNMRC
jgi:hypothetical protein